MANTLQDYSLDEFEEGCAAFVKDWEDDNIDFDVEFLFPILLDRKLKYYEEEY